MSTFVKIVDDISSEMELLSILSKLENAPTAEAVEKEFINLQRFITKLKDLPGVEVKGEVTVDLSEKEWLNWMEEAVSYLPMKEASAILNRNAWKIKEIILKSDFGDDPENVWHADVTFLGNEIEGEFVIEADDYRTILKKIAILSLLLDLEE